jgi:glucose-6-phosphate 1-dehydrogenase
MPTTADPPLSDTLVMFGASGDLAKKKLFPAVYRLTKRGILGVPVIGVALDHWTDDELRAHAKSAIVDNPDEDFDEATFAQLAANLSYVRGDYNDASLYPEIASRLNGAQHPLFHLAIPPSLFATVADGLADAGVAATARLIIEKPFGRDLASARALNDNLHQHFDESQIFRIDHFLGKEALRSLMVSRFANTVLEPIWNRNYVSSVKITMAEAFGVEDRGHFYDGVGALKDVLQNHLLQMTSLIAMNQPVDESAEALRDEKVRVLRSIRTLTPDTMVRGQYDGYLDVDGVAPDSDTETFVAIRLDIHSPRWAGVPFYIRTGKALERTVTEWTVEFRVPPRPLFVDDIDHPPPHNKMRILVKPEGQAQMTLLAKVPGEGMTVAPVGFEATARPTGLETEPYELLIEEAMKGDPTLFAREDSVEESWRIVDPVLTDRPKAVRYPKGSWGPPAAGEMLEPDGVWPDESDVPGD